jgi:hypothetical protein
VYTLFMILVSNYSTHCVHIFHLNSLSLISLSLSLSLSLFFSQILHFVSLILSCHSELIFPMGKTLTSSSQSIPQIEQWYT